ncbi:hypothetical protein BMS3Bbin04_01732 [bacterium BMS3Bbin04]|nr:hypothetical protein BMS3Bbin04_01732 [bacterium BMS3Bbin04]
MIEEGMIHILLHPYQVCIVQSPDLAILWISLDRSVGILTNNSPKPGVKCDVPGVGGSKRPSTQFMVRKWTAKIIVYQYAADDKRSSINDNLPREKQLKRI